MEDFMGSITANQALEWEVFSSENPPFEDAIQYQIAYIAMVFASVFIKKKDGSGFSIEDFMPWKKKEQTQNKVDGLVSAFKNVLLKVGDEKAKDWAGKGFDKPQVRGTDGKMYNYALEEFATRTKPPKRIIKEGRI